MKMQEIENAFGRVSNIKDVNSLITAGNAFIKELGTSTIVKTTGLTYQAIYIWTKKGIPSGWAHYFALRYPQIWGNYFYPLKKEQASEVQA